MLTLSFMHLWAFNTNCFKMLFSQQILDQLINTNQKLSRQFVIINWIEHCYYNYDLTGGECNVQQSCNSLSRMSFQPSKKYVSRLVRKAVLVLCYVIWLVIGPFIKKISDMWVIEINSLIDFQLFFMTHKAVRWRWLSKFAYIYHNLELYQHYIIK